MNKLFILLFVTFNINYLHASAEDKTSLAEDKNNPVFIQALIETADFHKKQGMAYFIMGDDRAETSLREAIKTGYADADVYNTLGNIYSDNYRDKERALENFTKAIELDPKLIEAYLKRSEIHFLLDNKTKALADINKVLELDFKNAEVYNKLGILNSVLGNSSASIQNFKKAIELDPKLAEAYNNLAVVYTALGQDRKAMFYFTEAIKLDSQLSTLNKKNSFWKRALSDTIYTNSFKAISSDSAEFYINLGKAKVDLGYYNEAVKDFTQVIKNKNGSQSDIAEAYYYRGVARTKNSIKDSSYTDTNYIEFKLVLKDMKKAIDLGYYKTASAHKYLGLALMEVASDSIFTSGKKFKAAIEALSTAIGMSLNPDEKAEAYSHRALARSFYRFSNDSNKNNLKVLADYNQSLKFNSKSAKNYNRRGIVNFELGNIEEAISDFTKAIEINPKFAEAYNNLAIVRNSLNEHTLAVELFVTAIKLNSSLATSRLEKTKESLGKLLSYSSMPSIFDVIFYGDKIYIRDRKKAAKIVANIELQEQAKQEQQKQLNTGKCADGFN